jgi:hypothetical protein
MNEKDYKTKLRKIRYNLNVIQNICIITKKDFQTDLSAEEKIFDFETNLDLLEKYIKHTRKLKDE